jgi:hypothetical protein
MPRFFSYFSFCEVTGVFWGWTEDYPMITKELEMEALSIGPIDKIRLVEMLLESLDKLDPEIEAAWVVESERRYAAYTSEEN